MAEADESFGAEVEALCAATKAVNEKDHAEVEAAADWIAQVLPPGTTKLDNSLREAAVRAGISERLLRRAKRSMRRDGRLPQLTEK